MRGLAAASVGTVGSEIGAATGAEALFLVAAAGQAAPLLLDPADAPPVLRAAGDLQADIESVSGAKPQMLLLAAGQELPGTDMLVVIGTLGRNAWVDDLARRGLIDSPAIAGRWEGLLMQAVEQPWPGVARALVLAGSDPRGCVFAQYTFSERIGVSPWQWWANVPPHQQAVVGVAPNTRLTDAPVVRWRGIFLNDEAPALTGWVQQFHGGYTNSFYARVFELLLRLRANLLWPAMWNAAFYADDPLNGPTAAAYGVVMGTSHHEPLMRAQREWHRYGEAAQRGPWDYRRNGEQLRQFWAGGAQRAAQFETISTVGMRGDGDEPMEAGTDVALLSRIIEDQRVLLAQATGRKADEAPQVLALYKEVQGYLEAGLQVPDDVLLLFSDDNWGHIRRLPTAAQRQRKGGAGIYFHFDYVGGPRSYKWLNVSPLSQVWEQMNLAWQHGADRLWIANVGDLKPMEVPMEFFLRYAWNPAAWPAEKLPSYLPSWATREFGAEHAQEAAALVAGYARINGLRKPELLDADTYSLLNEHEAERMTAQWSGLVERAERWWQALPLARRDAGFQLVLHPVLACANLQALYDAVGRNRLYAKQGRASAMLQADRARECFARDAAIAQRYHALNGGKWNHLMSQTHIGYTSWNQPKENRLPDLSSVTPGAAAALGLAVEGQALATQSPLRLPAFDAWAPQETQQRWLDLFNKGLEPLRFRMECDAPWVQLDAIAGTLETDRRVQVSVRWAALAPGAHSAVLRVSGSDGSRHEVQISALQAGARPLQAGHLEALGVVAIEAGHSTQRQGGWLEVAGLGRTHSGMTPAQRVGALTQPHPVLTYTLHLRSSGTFTLHALLSPTLNIQGGQGLRYAVAFNDEAPQTVFMHRDMGEPEKSTVWARWVKEGVMTHATQHRFTRAGPHTLRFWALDAGLVLQRLVLDTGGLLPSYLGPVASEQVPA
jgi:hypothetical protein